MKCERAQRKFLRPAGTVALVMLLAVSAAGQDAGNGAKYVPSQDLIGYLEWDGLDAHADAWKKTAASRVLNETTTGAMFEQIISQLADSMPAGPQGRAVTGAEAAEMVEHVVHKGLVLGIAGKPKQDKDPRITAVIRGAGAGRPRALFEKLIRQNDRGQVPQTRNVGGRELTLFGEAPQVAYFVEGDDLVVVSGDLETGIERVMQAIAGDAPSAADHPIRQELLQAEGAFEPVGLGFLDIKAVPLPPQAQQLGLDGVERIDYRWGFQDEAIVSVSRIRAPSPRRGVLAALDQPTFHADDLPPLPEGLRNFTVLSIDLEKVLDAAATVPQIGQVLPRFEDEFRRQSGLRLREDVLHAFGPKWAFYIKPQTITMPMDPWSGMAQFIFHPPKLTALVQMRDPKSFRKTIEALNRTLNREMARAIRQGPVPELVRLDEGDGYALNMPPEVAPLPQGIRPALVIGEEYAALSISPEDAREALGSKPGANDLQEHGTLPDGLVALSYSDPREVVPEVIANLPFFLQLMGKAGEKPGSPKGMEALKRLRIDRELVPDPDAIRQFLFPGWVATTVDDAGLTVTSRDSVPSINPLSSGPVMVALLLPAVQAAREAARRAQCTNNLKQFGLAMHNYHSTFNHFPAAAITGDDGTPLLSWRVAILPYIEQAPLYEQFHLEEPWDSPHNKTLIDQMPPVYACPSGTFQPGHTGYRVFVGAGAAFELTEPAGIQNFTDGTSNTLLVVEAEESVPWTKPEGIPFDPEANPSDQTGSKHPGGFNALFADGSVRFISDAVNEIVLKALITRAGSEVISADSY